MRRHRSDPAFGRAGTIARHRYSAGGRTAATTATTGDAIATLWNPSTTKPIWLISYQYVTIDAVNSGRHSYQRITTRGTPGSTITPDIDNDWEKYAAPASGALIDLAAFSVQPTLATPFTARWHVPTGTGEMPVFFYPIRPVKIPPGTGFAATNPQASIAGAGDVTFEWME